MKRAILTFLTFCFCFSMTLNAQVEYFVLLHTGEQIWAENAKDYAEQSFIHANESIDGHYYRLLQFYEIPDQHGLDVLAQLGIELLEYIPNKTYLASIPVDFDVNLFYDLNVRSIMPIVTDLKVRTDLLSGNVPDWAVKGQQVELMVKYYKNLRHDAILDYCKVDGIKVLGENGYNNFLHVQIPIQRILEIASLPYISFMEPIAEPGQPEDDGGRSLHRANVIDSDMPSGRHYNGEGVSVLCRDDGVVGPHIDFQGRMTNLTNDLTGTHGDGVSGIMSGAGNFNPRFRGMATASTLWVINYQDDFLDNTMELFFTENVIITNSSYSNGCNAGYTGITAIVEQQLYNNPTLMHVFSAGNSNNNNCGYGAGNQWGNITGGHKQAKNCIATANLFVDGALVNSSSRGPAHDGRIKPDIAAHGQGQISTNPNQGYQDFGGTSAAAPGIAGINAMLQSAYMQLNNGETAESALIKACLLNTANEMGNIGPDFKFGWGHVNAYRAALTLEEERYFKNTINPGETINHTIAIPGGVQTARIMVYWADPEASVMTTKSLINDLDIKVIAPDASEHLPWILDHTPDPALLDLPATKGVDHLNNMEQVSIDFPAAGDYTLEVSGFELPFGNKEYWVVYDFRTTQITVTYPNGGERFVPGETEWIRWDAEGNDGFFQVFYSLDNGDNWEFVEGLIGDARMVEWVVPEALTGNALFRISNGPETDMSDGTFSIAPVPNGIDVAQACPDYIQVAWSPIEEATSYDVYLLGDKFMEVVGNTIDTFFNIPTINGNPTLDYWYAVGMNDATTNATGRRTIARFWNGGLSDCEDLQNDVGIEIILAPASSLASSDLLLGCDEIDQPISIEIRNNGQVPQSNFEVGYQIDDEPAVTETFTETIGSGETASYTFAQSFSTDMETSFSFKSWTNLLNDEAGFNDTVSQTLNVSFYSGFGVSGINYSENFENPSFPPQGFLINNPDQGVEWQEAEVTGINDFQTRATVFPNALTVANTRERDEFITELIDLTSILSGVVTFDVAYAMRSNRTDTLQIWASDDCGATFKYKIFEKFGNNLTTASQTNGFFQPSGGNQWKTESAGLADVLGGSAILKFVNISMGGNNLYIDNINITQIDFPNAIISATKTEACLNKLIAFTAASEGPFITHEWSFGPNASILNAFGEGPHFVLFLTPGIHPVSLYATNGAGTDTMILEISIITDDPIASFDVSNNNGQVTFTNTSTGAEEFLWNFGDGNTSNEESPVHIYTSPGSYEVTLIVENDCGNHTITQTVDITTGVNDLNLNFSAALMPNPTSGLFEVVLESDDSQTLTIELLDLRGILIQREKVMPGNGIIRKAFDASELAAGVYFVKIQGEEGFLTKRIVVE